MLDRIHGKMIEDASIPPVKLLGGDNRGFDVTDPRFGAKCDGVTNDTAAIQAAVDAAPEFSTIIFPPNKTVFFTSIVCTKSLNFDFNGCKLIVDPTTSGLNGSPVIWFKGSVGTLYNITNSVQDSITVTLANAADAANFAPGDHVVITDNRIVPAWDANPSFGYIGRSEITMISSIAGAVITLDKPIEWDYDTAPKIQKVTPLFQPKIYGASHITELDPGGLYSGSLIGACPHIFHFQYCIDPSVEHCVFEKWQLHCVNFNYCIGAEVGHCSARDPYRPTDGGHGYFMRFDHCYGGVARNNFTRAVRHTVDYTQSYNGHSEYNYALNPVDVQFYMHGLGSKRCSSAYDNVMGGDQAKGWAMGNRSFSADYDFDIINPKYVANAAAPAIACQTNSVGMRVISPDIQTGGRAFAITTGASQVQILGGKVKSTGKLPGSTEGVLSRAKLAVADTFGINPRDITIDGVEFYGFANLFIEADGVVSITNNKFMMNDTSASGAIVIGVNIAPQDLFIMDNKILGSYQRGIQVAPEPTRTYVVARNFTDGGHSAVAFLLVGSTKMRLLDNQAMGASGLYTFTGMDIDTAKAGGATVAHNFPDTWDDMTVKTAFLKAKQATIFDVAGTMRNINFATGSSYGSNSTRWIVRANSTAEAGANAGTDLEIVARDDTGGNIGTALSIERKTGLVKFPLTSPEFISTYQKPLRLSGGNGGNFMWVDSAGKLRIKAGSILPANETDGTVVSFQNRAQGSLVYNGDGATTTKVIPHGLGVAPTTWGVTAGSADAGTGGIKYVTADTTNLTVFFNAAPISGTNNVRLNWSAEI